MAGGRKHLEQEPGCASLLSLQWIFSAHTSFVRLFFNILPDLKTYSKKGHFATLSPKSVELLRSLSAEWKRDGNPARSSEQISLFLPFSVSPVSVVQWDKSALVYCVDPRSLLPFTWRPQCTSHQVDSLWISRGEWVDSFSSYLHFLTDISGWIKKRIQFPGQPQHPRDGAFCLWTQEGNPIHCTQLRIRSGTATATRFSLQSNVYLKPFPPPSFFFDCIYIAALRLHQHSPIFFLRPNTFHLLLNLVASSFLFTLLSPHLSFHLSFIHLSIPFSLYFPLFYVPS